MANAGSDFERGHLSLHLRGKDHDIYGVMTAVQNLQDVAQGGGLWRGHNSDPLGQCWNRLLTFGVEQTFGLEFCFELFEGDLQGARTFGFQILGGDLQVSAFFVNGDATARHYLHAIFWPEPQQALVAGRPFTWAAEPWSRRGSCRRGASRQEPCGAGQAECSC